MNKVLIASAILIAAAFSHATIVSAQSALSLSVSPTLFEMSANPNQEWTSTVRVINPNPYEISVYTNVVNFAPQGDGGEAKFVPLVKEEASGQTVAEWIDITDKAIVIPAEQTVEVPFVIQVPENAPPGGHYAALLIGTKPPEDDGTVQVKTSQVVTTLLFLRVTGDVIEDGDIRSFRTTERLLEKPEATFELRFENKGNVHILPQGEIRILNMWAQERGIIPINRVAMFGNVLPENVRKYNFTWTGEWSLADMGRYTAIATLVYGENGRQTVSSETAFWVIPWRALLLTLLILFSFIAVFTWAIKLYIRKMLSMAGVAPGETIVSRNTHRISVVAPIEEGMLDLRGQWKETTTWGERLRTVGHFVRQYHIFFVVLLLTICFLGGVYWYINSASESERAYNVTIDGQGNEITISSEEVKYQQQKEAAKQPITTVPDADLPLINIVNRSGVTGLAVDLRMKLEEKGYQIVDLSTDIGAVEKNTVIVYDPAYATEALSLSQEVYGALLSAFVSETKSQTPITVYVGQDLENAVQ